MLFPYPVRVLIDSFVPHLSNDLSDQNDEPRVGQCRLDDRVRYSFCPNGVAQLGLGYCRATIISEHFTQGLFDDVEQNRFEAIIRAEITCL